VIGDSELEQLDAMVETALESGDEEGLPVLGYGEISLVLCWPPGDPRFACKRLPAFRSAERLDAYRRTLDAYLEALEAAGIRVVETQMRGVPRRDGGVNGYLIQPVLPAETLVPTVLAANDPEAGHPVIPAVTEAAARAVSPRVGLDAQLDNWTWDEGGLTYIDVSTPMLWSQDERPLLDLEGMSKAFPWIVRGALMRFIAPGILDTYRELRKVYFDLCGNLLKRRLEPWLSRFLEAANAHLAQPITAEQVHAYYRRDARLWAVLLRMRRLDRAWYRRVRRRPYPFLLPRDTER
jgi:Family of unknown function (DUF6206)